MALDQESFINYLKNPVMFPPEFKDWVSDYMAVNIPKLHVNQIQGFKLQSVKESETGDIAAQEAITSTSYVAFSTDGPTFSNVPNGYYLLFFGATYGNTASQPAYGATWAQVYLAPIVDGGAASDADAAILNAGTNGRVVLLDLTDPTVGNHTITFHAKRTTATMNDVALWQRWAFLIKVVTDDSTV